MNVGLHQCVQIAIAMSPTCTGIAHCRCVLPVPEDRQEKPTAANQHGHISSIHRQEVLIQKLKTGKDALVRIPKGGGTYSAFGGDVPQDDLALGQLVWVCYRGCKSPSFSAPEEAYFQVYSKDVHDKP